MLRKLIIRFGYRGIILNLHSFDSFRLACQLEAIEPFFDFISLNEMARRMEEGAARPFCLVTFDDGKKRQAGEMADLLKAKGIPAVFYLTTGALDTGRPLWFDIHTRLLREIGHTPPGLDSWSLKGLPLEVIQERLYGAIRRHGLEMSDYTDDPDLCPMNWDDARRLHTQGFDIGAHGVTHALLTNETHERARFEIEHSMRRVSEELGIRCTTFAFPNGNCNARLRDLAARAGAETVMTTIPRWVRRSCSPLALPRIQLHPFQGPRRVRAKIAAALPGFLLKNPDGSRRAYLFGGADSGKVRERMHPNQQS
ncbi:MAG: polysaccharide deacetylase [Desulfacinum sp.]|jgi:peptidoglycan/xylan/chitin deacetylase (PgdA/CDA1 family)|nr:polysaccharide deacetylase [Desulfacinum sp.]